MSDNDRYYLGLAIKAAKENPIEKLPKMAALIVTTRNDHHIGLNRYKTHPLQARFASNPEAIFLHAEIDAIVESEGWFLHGSSIYIARVNKAGIPVLAKPCIGCAGALFAYGVEHIHWTENSNV